MKWIAFLDIDEMLIPENATTVGDVLKGAPHQKKQFAVPPRVLWAVPLHKPEDVRRQGRSVAKQARGESRGGLRLGPHSDITSTRFARSERAAGCASRT